VRSGWHPWELPLVQEEPEVVAVESLLVVVEPQAQEVVALVSLFQD